MECYTCSKLIILVKYGHLTAEICYSSSKEHEENVLLTENLRLDSAIAPGGAEYARLL
jgi:hypothetical protein